MMHGDRTISSSNHRRSSGPGVACLALVAASLGGCGFKRDPGSMQLLALGSQPNLLETEFTTAAYGVREAEESFWFADVPLETVLAHDKGQPLRNAVILHAQLVWTPEPGLTPLDPSATNLVTRVIVVSNGEVGLYGGAAFARPKGDPGAGDMMLRVEGGTLTLLAKTAGFTDLLSPAGLEGSFTATHAPDEAQRWRNTLSQFVTNALGTSTWVDAGTPATLEPNALDQLAAAFGASMPASD